MNKKPVKYQVHGSFYIECGNWDEALNILSICSSRGLKAISINILEIQILSGEPNDPNS